MNPNSKVPFLVLEKIYISLIKSTCKVLKDSGNLHVDILRGVPEPFVLQYAQHYNYPHHECLQLNL